MIKTIAHRSSSAQTRTALRL